MERDMYAVARCLDPTPASTKAGVNSETRTIFDEYESFRGSTERIKFILMRFATNTYLGKEDSYKETALHLAAYYGHTKLVALLIDAARYMQKDDLSNTKNHFEAFVRQGDDKMNTALHLAVRKCYVDIVKLLVEADPSYTHINSENETPIYLAASLGYNDIVKVICRACIAPTFDGPGGTTALHAAIKMRPEAMKKNNDVVQVIINAARISFSREQFVAFVGQIDKNEDSALHLAVRGNHLDVVKLILQDVEPTRRNKDLKSPIYMAAEQGNRDIVKLLCETCKSDEITSGPRGKTSLHAAVIGGDPDCIEFILRKAEGLVKCVDEKGLTPLWLATQKGHTFAVRKLVELSPEDSCNTVNQDGRNILHFAAFQSDKEMIKCILASCPAKYIDKILNEKDINGDTPIHLLIREGCFVPEFINHTHIDIMAKNKQHYTPVDMLYLEDQIIADQLEIKKTLDKIRSNWVWISNKPESLVPPSKRLRKDAEFKNAEEKLNKKGLELYRERTTTQIIVTALITTVTFTVGFTMPGGYNQSGDDDEGMVVLSKKTAFNVFMVADALALVLSITSLFLYFISSMYQDTHKVAKYNAASTGLNIVSVMAMMLTFIAGTYVVLGKSQTLAVTVCVICCIFFLIVIGLSVQMIYDRRKMIYDRIKVERYEV